MGGKKNKRENASDRSKGTKLDRNRWIKQDTLGEMSPRHKPKSHRNKAVHRTSTIAAQITIDDVYEADRQLGSRWTSTDRPLAEQIDVHTCYQEAVQLPQAEVENLVNMYGEAQRDFGQADELGQYKKPTLLREDFCGTAILCRAFCKSHVEREAVGVDLDESVIKYAREVTLAEGPESERVRVVHGNVLSTPMELKVSKVDIIAGLNYGCFYFKKRADLVKYLTNSRMGLREGGVLIVDVFGGARVTGSVGRLVRREFGKFSYFFEQKPFEVMTNTARVHLHFRFEDGSWLKDAFEYDFRAYTIIEIKEAMLEAGFCKTQTWVAPSAEQENVEDDEEDGEHSEDDDHVTSSESNGIHEYRKLNGPMIQIESYNAYIVAMA
ncbi:hypothetical protein HDV00_002906 [Rhizophlyctis rosea]|nr:hypothetical protein HDV00_002906 [Rhizophlyctis rosea]